MKISSPKVAVHVRSGGLHPATRPWLYFAGVCLLASGVTGAEADRANNHPAPSPKIEYAREVRPILASHCFKCHGQDEGARKARMRLDVRENALSPAKSGELPIVPGRPELSELLIRIGAEHEDDLMPPPSTKNPLTPADQQILRRWIEEGAEYQPHWAYRAPTQAALPKVKQRKWPHNAIDYFVLARLEKEGLKPAPRADPATLVRRLYLDLTGLPPTPAQAETYLRDPAPDAYERLVDRLLASPHYGERWARRWLDLARYADSNGYEKDRPRSLWPWRDWVINALNADLPFDEFTREQIAGDLLPNATREQIIATGFNRNSMINEEGGTDPLEYRFYSMVDRTQVTATNWLGLTMACAQCHTHKYDPIPHEEYYRFMAFMDNAIEPTLPLVDPTIAAKRQEIQERIDVLESTLPDRFPLELRATWQIPGAAAFSSSQGAVAQSLSDGSFRIEGEKPVQDTYTLRFEARPQRITHVQVEVIPEAREGPDAKPTGDFVLDELELEIQPVDTGSAPRRLKFSSAQADSAKAGFAAAYAIDGRPETGWAPAGSGETGQHHHAIFTLAEPEEMPGPGTITVRLVQSHGSRGTLGHFRVSLGEELPEDRALTERRRRELRDRRGLAWLAGQLPAAAAWQPLRPVAATSTAPILTVQEDGSIFCNGDFTKSDTYTLKFHDLPAGIKALRLEMLPDDRLPNRGPGAVYYEGTFGNFWLSTLRVQADGRALALAGASESLAEKNNNAAQAIDDDPQTGWSIANGVGRTQNAVFQLADPLPAARELQLDLVCEKYYAAGLGRFRVWVTTESDVRAGQMDNESLAVLARYREPEALTRLFAAPDNPPDRAGLLRQFALNSADFARAREEINQLRATLPKYPTTLVMQERPPGQERPTYVRHRGEFLQPRAAVTPGVPAFLPPLPDNAPRNRLGLAQWLVSPENPLTGRVIMNRQWEALFGRGIVRTTEDLGLQGDLPSHPELLDWLAVEFSRQGWSQKKMLKLMVMSATYQQSSAVPAPLLERDPGNLLLARGPRFRLEAEMLRDSALVASGLFTATIGGPSVYPPQPPGVSSEGAYGPLEWKTSEGPDRYRRGLYTFAKRTAPYAMTATFDGPSGEVCLARRDRSNTPLQALTWLNDEVIMECARELGRLAARAGGDTDARLELIFRRCLTRPPTVAERAKLGEFYQAQLARLAGGELVAAEIMAAPPDEHLNEQAAWATLARVLLNLDEALNKS